MPRATGQTKKPSTKRAVLLSKLPRRHKKAPRPKLKRSDTGTRVLQIPERIWYKPLTWRHHPPVPNYAPLPKARKLFWRVLKQIWAYKALFSGLIIIYGLLDLILVHGLTNTSDFNSINSVLQDGVGGIFGKALTSFLSFGYLVSNSNSGGTTDTSGLYQTVLILLCSLAFIWAFRQVVLKQKVRIRDCFYLGMYPLVPFLLLFLLGGIQLLPMGIGGGIFSTVINTGIAVHLWEKGLFLLAFILLAFWSLRMVTATIFAFYIVTLPNMTPVLAYRTARNLVYGRRWLLWRKLIFLPIILLILAAAIEIPLIVFSAPLAVWTFFILSMLALPLVHGYLYNLYRDML